MTRRQLLQKLTFAASVGMASNLMSGRPGMAADETNEAGAYAEGLLPSGVRSRFVNGVNGLRMHVLEAGYEGRNRPGVLLLHGFPELAYSWRNVMVPLAEAGFHVFAPDQRGYGRTTGWDDDYDGDLASFRRLNIVRDALGLVFALGHQSVATVVGHDFGSPIAAWCAVIRPDVFQSVALMSAPFSGTPSLPSGTANDPTQPVASSGPSLFDQLAALRRPRKHYQRYYTTRGADKNMRNAPQGIHAFLRAYYHYKSADWAGNRPFRLEARTATEMAKMPTYYIMDLADGMAETVAKHMPSAKEIAANSWLPDAELRVYSEEFARTGFQGGLNWYRSGSIGAAEQQLFAGRTIDQPSIFISGASDWGSYQSPGALERMQDTACTDMRGAYMVEGAGHWVQQEQPEQTGRLLIDFLGAL
ncbi:alpha/beta fold hydrolase [Stieleria neptunia]|nr:alpha/beta fold hydrolase [Stieleria neptunia]